MMLQAPAWSVHTNKASFDFREIPRILLPPHRSFALLSTTHYCWKGVLTLPYNPYPTLT